MLKVVGLYSPGSYWFDYFMCWGRITRTRAVFVQKFCLFRFWKFALKSLGILYRLISGNHRTGTVLEETLFSLLSTACDCFVFTYEASEQIYFCIV